MFEFKPFDKIPRYNRTVTVAEKIDGTNALVAIFEVDAAADRDELLEAGAIAVCTELHPGNKRYAILAGSRNRWLSPENVGPRGCDNFAFAAWVRANASELFKLGPGFHYGEWWGAGIGRRYGLTEKRFSLFNTARWGAHNPPPACCNVVPILYRGRPDGINQALEDLRLKGSSAAPGFMNPEGVIVYHQDSRQYYKLTLEHDEVPKSVAQTTAAQTEYQAQLNLGLQDIAVRAQNEVLLGLSSNDPYENALAAGTIWNAPV